MATEDEVNFYSRPRVWGDQWATARNARFTNFYSRPAWGATFIIRYPSKGVFISTRVPARGATESRSRWQINVQISTHAPAWGATPSSLLFLSVNDISTHAPE